MELRYYQREAIDAIADYIANNVDNPCVEIPTGGGKTPIIASLAGELVAEGNRVLIIAHRKELLEQTRDKLNIWAPNIPFGIFSSGLNRRDCREDVLIAGIQSVYKYGTKISEYGIIDYLIIDECHLIPTTAEKSGGMFRTLIDDLTRCNPNLTIIGFTATPYRTSGGVVYGKENILNNICYSVSVRELIANGYLCPLVSKAPPINISFDNVAVIRGEFDKKEVDQLVNKKNVIHKSCQELLKFAANRRKILVFCCSIAHTSAVVEQLRSLTNDCVELLTGETKADERDQLLRRFKGEQVANLIGETKPEIRILCNVDILTTGFDAPNVDCVVMLRPTKSPGLYYQMVGRGFRPDVSKKDCLILDYGENIKRHGPVDAIIVNPKKKKESPKTKSCPKCFSVLDKNDSVCDCCGFVFESQVEGFVCPECGELNSFRALFCCMCGYRFPLKIKQQETAETELDILSNNDLNQPPELIADVMDETYWEHRKTGDANAIPCLWCSYKINERLKLSEFIGFENPSGDWRQRAAVAWWRKRSKAPVPKTVFEAIDLIRDGAIAKTKRIWYRPESTKNKYPKILRTEVDEIPDYVPEFTENPYGFHCDCGNQDTFHYYQYISQSDPSFPPTYRIVCASCNKIYHHGYIPLETYPLLIFKKVNIDNEY